MHIGTLALQEHPRLVSRHVPTVAEAIAELQKAQDLKSQDRRNMIAALRTVPRAYRLPAESIRLEPEELGRCYFGCSAATLGVSEASLAPYRTSVRRVLRRYGLIVRPRRGNEVLSPVWQALYDGLPDKFSSIRLRGLMAWCHAQGIEPSDVPADILDRYLEFQRHEKAVHAPTAVVRKVAQAWNRGRASVPGWPDLILEAPNSTKQYSLPLDAYPSSLREEAKAWQASRSEQVATSLFDGGTHRPLRQATIDHRLKYFRLGAAALVATGTPVGAITSLRTLVTPDAIRTILEWHWARGGRQVSRNTAGMATTLVMIAEFVGMTGPALEEVRQLAKRASPKKRSRMTERNEVSIR